MDDAPWYQRFFTEIYLQSYAPILAQVDTDQQVNFLVERLQLQSGMRVLDLCCGQGRHSVPLAQRGLRVTGQDLSEYLLGQAKQSAKAAGVDIEFVHRDMRDIQQTDEFDAVINMFTAFGYFEEDAENFKVLAGVAKALKPGGRFCLDVISYAWLMRHWQSLGWDRGEGDLLSLEERRMDWLTGIQSSARTVIRPYGTREQFSHAIRLFPTHELVQWLARAGLRTEALYGDFAGTPYGLDCSRTIVVAQKVGTQEIREAGRQ